MRITYLVVDLFILVVKFAAYFNKLSLRLETGYPERFRGFIQSLYSNARIVN
jgi:hypothetical protein